MAKFTESGMNTQSYQQWHIMQCLSFITFMLSQTISALLWTLMEHPLTFVLNPEEKKKKKRGVGRGVGRGEEKTTTNNINNSNNNNSKKQKEEEKKRKKTNFFFGLTLTLCVDTCVLRTLITQHGGTVSEALLVPITQVGSVAWGYSRVAEMIRSLVSARNYTAIIKKHAPVADAVVSCCKLVDWRRVFLW